MCNVPMCMTLQQILCHVLVIIQMLLMSDWLIYWTGNSDLSEPDSMALSLDDLKPAWEQVDMLWH